MTEEVIEKAILIKSDLDRLKKFKDIIEKERRCSIISVGILNSSVYIVLPSKYSESFLQVIDELIDIEQSKLDKL